MGKKISECPQCGGKKRKAVDDGRVLFCPDCGYEEWHKALGKWVGEGEILSYLAWIRGE